MRKTTGCVWVLAAVLLALPAGCAGNGGDKDAVPDTGKDAADVPAADAEVAEDADAGPETPGDVATDVSPFPLPVLTDPVPLRVGTASAALPAPLGIPICGFMPPEMPGSPYSDKFPASQVLFMPPTLRVIALEGGTQRLIFLRMDLIGVNTTLLERVAHDLTEITGYDFHGRVIAGASHSHSSAGRLVPGVVWETLVDTFFPALFNRVVQGCVDTAVAALLDMVPAKMGYGVVETAELHNDRRCENPELRDDRLHLLRFDDAEGEVKALLMVHSLHGTIFGVESQHLSRDAVGGLEEKVKESFDHPVEVMYLQAGAGDMAPNSPPFDESSPLPAVPHDYSRVEALGAVAAEVVQSKVGEIQTSSEVAVDSLWAYVPLGREVMGYEGDEFPYAGGGAYCGMSVDAACWSGEATPLEGLDKMCLDIQALSGGEAAPDRTLLAAARVGELLIVAFPGEPVTQIMLNVEQGIKDAMAAQKDVIVLGYAMDYIGYSTPEWDWYQGGYEAAGAIWGPKQGDYLTQAAIETGLYLLDPAKVPGFDDPGPYPLLEPNVAPYAPTGAADAGKVVTQPNDSYGTGETVVFEFAGGDPWHLVPDVVLEKKSEAGEFVPVTHKSGGRVDSMGYAFELRLIPSPGYEEEPKAQVRTFTWHVEMPTDRRIASDVFPLSGEYRLSVTGQYRPQGAVEWETYSVQSEPFVAGAK